MRRLQRGICVEAAACCRLLGIEGAGRVVGSCLEILLRNSAACFVCGAGSGVEAAWGLALLE
jgi:hypothetical protein